jgi:hypothetical protein
MMSKEHGIIPSSEMWRCLARVRTCVHEELITSIIMVERISDLATAVLTSATRRHISKDVILYGHRHENLKSYKEYINTLLRYFSVRTSIQIQFENICLFQHI